MRAEITCAVCGHSLNFKYQSSRCCYTLIVPPCRNCYQSKREKVTPKKGEIIEVRGTDFEEGVFNTRIATGDRCKETLVVATKHNTPSPFFDSSYWHQWRYPGETAWRD